MKTIATGSRKGLSLYYFNGSTPQTDYVNVASSAPDLHTWHHRLGHISYQGIIDMAKKGMDLGMPTDLHPLESL
jgi:hypothetical protein